MTDSLLLPVCLDRIVNTNGVPYSGAKVYVYDAGTTDLKNVYTNATLLSAAANPIVADAGGYITSRYIGIGSYKLVIKDANDNTIKTEDNLPGALDTSPFSASTAKPVTPVIATAISRIIAVAELGSVVVADPTGGNITITLPDAGDAGDGKRLTVIHDGTSGQVIIEEAETIATLVTAPQAVTLISDAVEWRVQGRSDPNVVNRIVPPQGYLTLVSATPIITSDQAAKTNVYYTPFVGDAVPVYNGMRFIPQTFAELTLALVTQHLASNLYDVFIFLDTSDGTTVRIGTGPSWADGAVAGSVTAGSCARGTGAASTDLTRVQGFLVNANAITARNGSNTYSVPANKATYVGSLFIDGSAGQVTCHTSYGQSRKWGVWNAYNQREIILRAGDSTASWTYGTNTTRASNNASANSLTTFSGLPDSPQQLSFLQRCAATGNSTSMDYTAQNSIGVNSTSSASGTVGRANSSVSGTVSGATAEAQMLAAHLLLPTIGINVITAQETTPTATNMTVTYYGTEGHMLLAARWRG